jgi:hypothetical protein
MNAVQDAIERVFISPNESGANLEPANVVDGLFAISRAIRYLASSIQDVAAAYIDAQR